jgi:hypothetical protein
VLFYFFVPIQFKIQLPNKLVRTRHANLFTTSARCVIHTELHESFKTKQKTENDIFIHIYSYYEKLVIRPSIKTRQTIQIPTNVCSSRNCSTLSGVTASNSSADKRKKTSAEDLCCGASNVATRWRVAEKNQTKQSLKLLKLVTRAARDLEFQFTR